MIRELFFDVSGTKTPLKPTKTKKPVNRQFYKTVGFLPEVKTDAIFGIYDIENPTKQCFDFPVAFSTLFYVPKSTEKCLIKCVIEVSLEIAKAFERSTVLRCFCTHFFT